MMVFSSYSLVGFLMAFSFGVSSALAALIASLANLIASSSSSSPISFALNSSIISLFRPISRNGITG